eukprot:g1891.t1
MPAFIRIAALTTCIAALLQIGRARERDAYEPAPVYEVHSAGSEELNGVYVLLSGEKDGSAAVFARAGEHRGGSPADVLSPPARLAWRRAKASFQWELSTRRFARACFRPKARYDAQCGRCCATPEAGPTFQARARGAAAVGDNGWPVPPEGGWSHAQQSPGASDGAPPRVSVLRVGGGAASHVAMMPPLDECLHRARVLVGWGHGAAAQARFAACAQLQPAADDGSSAHARASFHGALQLAQAAQSLGGGAAALARALRHAERAVSLGGGAEGGADASNEAAQGGGGGGGGGGASGAGAGRPASTSVADAIAAAAAGQGQRHQRRTWACAVALLELSFLHARSGNVTAAAGALQMAAAVGDVGDGGDGNTTTLGAVAGGAAAGTVSCTVLHNGTVHCSPQPAAAAGSAAPDLVPGAAPTPALLPSQRRLLAGLRKLLREPARWPARARAADALSALLPRTAAAAAAAGGEGRAGARRGRGTVASHRLRYPYARPPLAFAAAASPDAAIAVPRGALAGERERTAAPLQSLQATPVRHLLANYVIGAPWSVAWAAAAAAGGGGVDGGDAEQDDAFVRQLLLAVGGRGNASASASAVAAAYGAYERRGDAEGGGGGGGGGGGVSAMPSLSLVVAHYSENLEWLRPLCGGPRPARLFRRIFVYSKSPRAATDAGLRAVLPAELRARAVIDRGGDGSGDGDGGGGGGGSGDGVAIRLRRLPNVGREGHTFLHHVWREYDGDVARAAGTAFLQGAPHAHFRFARLGALLRACVRVGGGSTGGGSTAGGGRSGGGGGGARTGGGGFSYCPLGTELSLSNRLGFPHTPPLLPLGALYDAVFARNVSLARARAGLAGGGAVDGAGGGEPEQLFAFANGGQFVAPGSALRCRPRELYAALLTPRRRARGRGAAATGDAGAKVDADADADASRAAVHGGAWEAGELSERVDPIEGYLYERLWPVLFEAQAGAREGRAAEPWLHVQRSEVPGTSGTAMSGAAVDDDAGASAASTLTEDDPESDLM